MTNPHLQARLRGLQQMLMGAHGAGTSLSSSTKGNEREAFINAFLSDVLPPQFRFGTGDATDQMGRRSGQLDIVIEYPFVPSLPLVAGRSPRLYLAEGIVAVIEVKSNVADQWNEVLTTAKQLANLERNYGSGFTFGPRAGPRVPLYAVGYTGWKTLATLRQKLTAAPEVNGILVIDRGHFQGKYTFIDGKDQETTYEGQCNGDAMALWWLITLLHHAGSMITSTTKDVPRQYANEA